MTTPAPGTPPREDTGWDPLAAIEEALARADSEALHPSRGTEEPVSDAAGDDLRPVETPGVASDTEQPPEGHQQDVKKRELEQAGIQAEIIGEDEDTARDRAKKMRAYFTTSTEHANQATRQRELGMHLAVRAFEQQDWKTLSYLSWDEYIREEIGENLPRLSKTERQQWVRELTKVGMSARSIGPVVGASRETVRRDQAELTAANTSEDASGTDTNVSVDEEPRKVTGLDGKIRRAITGRAVQQPHRGMQDEPEYQLDDDTDLDEEEDDGPELIEEDGYLVDNSEEDVPENDYARQLTSRATGLLNIIVAMNAHPAPFAGSSDDDVDACLRVLIDLENVIYSFRNKQEGSE